MRLRIEHRTSLTYDAPISEAYTELRLRPLGGAGQHCVSFRIDTEPPGVRTRAYVDHRGNEVHHFDVLEPHDRLTVTARSDVLTPDVYLDAGPPLTLLERHDYLAPTGYVTLSEPVRRFAEQHDPGGSAVERATALAAAVHGALVYEAGVTHVHTHAEEALTLGRGVCQDFAHLLIAACRCRGVHARYVSGYLYDPSLPGGAAASHAWVDVYDEEQGWLSVDPTHDRRQTAAYVRLGVGRDYADVPPTRGVFTGNAGESLDVGVALTTF